MEIVERKGAFGLLVERARRAVVPIGVHFDLTYRCDLDCVHCYLADRTRRDLSTDEVRALHRELRSLGTLFLLVSGGDVFVRRDAIELLADACRLGFEVRLITHGGAIDDERADALASMGIRVVAMSIYSTIPQEHDRITRVPGSWTRTVEAAKRLRARRVPVQLKGVLMRGNEGQGPALRALANELECGIEFDAEIRGADDGSRRLLDLNLSPGERVAAAACIYGESLGPVESEMHDPSSVTCLAGHASCYIGPDGVVQPCLEWTQAAGNVRDEGGFRRVWEESPLFERIRGYRRSSFQGCSSCEHYGQCGLCPAKAWRETGNPLGSAPSKCAETTTRVLVTEQLRRERGSAAE